jgi:hypothetical protein
MERIDNFSLVVDNWSLSCLRRDEKNVIFFDQMRPFLLRSAGAKSAHSHFADPMETGSSVHVQTSHARMIHAGIHYELRTERARCKRMAPVLVLIVARFDDFFRWFHILCLFSDYGERSQTSFSWRQNLQIPFLTFHCTPVTADGLFCANLYELLIDHLNVIKMHRYHSYMVKISRLIWILPKVIICEWNHI